MIEILFLFGALFWTIIGVFAEAHLKYELLQLGFIFFIISKLHEKKK